MKKFQKLKAVIWRKLIVLFPRNPGYPSGYTTAGTCSYKLQKCDPNICQIRFKKFYFENISSLTSPYFRLDFTDFTLAGPITTGACTTDYFQATGAATGKMRLFVIFSMKIIFHEAPTKEPLAICLQESVVSTLDIIFILMLAQVWPMMLL